MAIIPGRRAASSPETISLHLMMVSAFALAAHREDVIRWGAAEDHARKGCVRHFMKTHLMKTYLMKTGAMVSVLASNARAPE
ncbi:hypothetical protein X566_21075 [Afipia sp. P52-10]|uniref:hypothetical protein n=1 Tax=Afipia sp. P52-10 TaxID=1429916 RepID=UPI0003DEFE03|nr:hypothetical protein [Afipia sp. P52-10]ETR75938.1 hypothetical protein X566_21075 [Afipia sp. P52-10]